MCLLFKTWYFMYSFCLLISIYKWFLSLTMFTETQPKILDKREQHVATSFHKIILTVLVILLNSLLPSGKKVLLVVYLLTQHIPGEISLVLCISRWIWQKGNYSLKNSWWWSLSLHTKNPPWRTQNLTSVFTASLAGEFLVVGVSAFSSEPG